MAASIPLHLFCCLSPFSCISFEVAFSRGSTALFVPFVITIAETACEGAQAQAPKAAVEFDQAINYVNKIKVREAQLRRSGNPAVPCVSWKHTCGRCRRR